MTHAIEFLMLIHIISCKLLQYNFIHNAFNWNVAIKFFSRYSHTAHEHICISYILDGRSNEKSGLDIVLLMGSQYSR